MSGDEQPAYPPNVLMIGGTRDGQYWTGQLDEHLRLARAPRKRKGAAQAEQLAEPLEFETYRLRQFRAAGQVLVIYGIEAIDDFEIQLALIRGYRRP